VAICRNLTESELPLIIEWAAKEGWNPGLHDHTAFYHADPDGFFALFEGDEPLAAVSMVKQTESIPYAFLGLYICEPSYRGKGQGYEIWETAMNYAQECTIGLDGVVDQQQNYRRSGFEFAYRNIRFQGKLAQLSAGALSDVRLANPSDHLQLLEMDHELGGIRRDRYLTHWFGNTEHRTTLLLESPSSGNVTGYGTIRRCREHFKIGPLCADSPDAAATLVSVLSSKTGADTVFIDVPEPNEHAMSLFRQAGFTPVFETARMYRGTAPKQRLDNIFGVATLELG